MKFVYLRWSMGDVLVRGQSKDMTRDTWCEFSNVPLYSELEPVAIFQWTIRGQLCRIKKDGTWSQHHALVSFKKFPTFFVGALLLVKRPTTVMTSSLRVFVRCHRSYRNDPIWISVHVCIFSCDCPSPTVSNVLKARDTPHQLHFMPEAKQKSNCFRKVTLDLCSFSHYSLCKLFKYWQQSGINWKDTYDRSTFLVCDTVTGIRLTAGVVYLKVSITSSIIISNVSLDLWSLLRSQNVLQNFRFTSVLMLRIEPFLLKLSIT